MKINKGLGLSSGGLDSILAGYVLRKQGIEVQWITFETPFFSAEQAKKAASFSGIPIIIENITEIYLEMLKNPRCGYGNAMNPCLDCHTLMFKLAGNIMKQREFDFLFSGEVLGQRPMSQTKQSLRYVEKNSGFEGYILRPLSAKLLPETIPENQGIVNRNMLLDISGRSRKQQIQLAKEFQITDYPSPAGGCLLTDKGFSKRLRDLFDHETGYDEDENELHLLKYGRHFRLNENTKIIVGRTQQDNQNIINYSNLSKHIIINTVDYPGPTVLAPRHCNQENLKLAGGICAGYSKAPDTVPIKIDITGYESFEQIQLVGIAPEKVRKNMI